MRNPEDAYKLKPDVKMPLFEKVPCKGSAEGLAQRESLGVGPISAYPVPHARRNDPATSKQAAASVTNLGRTRDAILWLLKNVGPLTDQGIAIEYEYELATHRQFPRVSGSGLRSRRSELVALNLVEDSGQRAKTGSGRQTIIWKAAK